MKLYSIGELSRLLDIPVHRIDYTHTSRHLDEPKRRFLGKRVYDMDDASRVAEHFGIPLVAEAGHDEPRSGG